MTSNVTTDDSWLKMVPDTKHNELEQRRLKSEYYYIRDLFDQHLPVGPNRDKLEEYFNDLHKVIFTKDPNDIQRIERECFEDDLRPVGDGASSSSYKHISASTFKQQASFIQPESHEQNVENSTLQLGYAPIPSQSSSKESKCATSVSEHPNGNDSDLLDLIGKFNDHDC